MYDAGNGILCNVCPLSEDLMEKADNWTVPPLALFFVISGAELQLGAFGDVAIVGIGIVYIVARSIGKYVGAYGGVALMHGDEKVKKYLGITLPPRLAWLLECV